MKIIHNKILGGWYIVRGPHHTPIGGRFDTKAEAQAWLTKQQRAREMRAHLESEARKHPNYIGVQYNQF